MRLYDQAKTCMTTKDEVMRRWMLHGNVSRRGYGNALIGRYGGCFEEVYKGVYDDRAYHAKCLDVPAKVVANSRSEKKEMHGTGEARKIWEGGSVNFRILTLVRRTHALIIGNSQSNKEVHKETSTPRRSVWGLVILAHPRLMVRECTLIF